MIVSCLQNIFLCNIDNMDTPFSEVIEKNQNLFENQGDIFFLFVDWYLEWKGFVLLGKDNVRNIISYINTLF